MKKSHRASFIVILFISIFGLAGCPSRTTVSKINSDPGRYHNKEVGIVGRVTESYGALGQGAYELDDETGRIWVVTERGVPSKGARVGVKGQVYNGFTFAGRNFGTVIKESDRRVQ